jgi:hypothetical protein
MQSAYASQNNRAGRQKRALEGFWKASSYPFGMKTLLGTSAPGAWVCLRVFPPVLIPTLCGIIVAGPSIFFCALRCGVSYDPLFAPDRSARIIGFISAAREMSGGEPFWWVVARSCACPRSGVVHCSLSGGLGFPGSRWWCIWWGTLVSVSIYLWYYIPQGPRGRRVLDRGLARVCKAVKEREPPHSGKKRSPGPDRSNEKRIKKQKKPSGEKDGGGQSHASLRSKVQANRRMPAKKG